MKNYLWLFLMAMLFSHPLLAGTSKVEPTFTYGANVYQARCTLCHGNQGYGDGMLPLSMKKYPHTNLHETKYGNDISSLRKSIIYGGSNGAMSNEMPPWGDELTYTQVESVAMFVHLMLTDRKQSDEILANTVKASSVSARAGRNLFKNFCSLCHGPEGEGDGKMARIIKNPPPFNLTKSTVPGEYLELIIMKGGGAIGRSPRMPPWAEQLTKDEVKSIVLYLKTIRK
jgi:cytochrome c oxidase cbb3-type subunit 3